MLHFTRPHIDYHYCSFAKYFETLRIQHQTVFCRPIGMATSCAKELYNGIKVMSAYLNERKQSFGHAFRGLKLVLNEEPHARIHVIGTILVLVAATVLRIETLPLVCLFICIGGVWITEALNSAIEAACDAITTQHHPQIGKAKDIAAGAVLLMSFTAVIVGCLVFGTRVVELSS